MCVRSVRIANTSILDLIICNGKYFGGTCRLSTFALLIRAVTDMSACITLIKSATIRNSEMSLRNDRKAGVGGGGDGSAVLNDLGHLYDISFCFPTSHYLCLAASSEALLEVFFSFWLIYLAVRRFLCEFSMMLLLHGVS
jgi:hypothetical protein